MLSIAYRGDREARLNKTVSRLCFRLLHRAAFLSVPPDITCVGMLASLRQHTTPADRAAKLIASSSAAQTVAFTCMYVALFAGGLVGWPPATWLRRRHANTFGGASGCRPSRFQKNICTCVPHVHAHASTCVLCHVVSIANSFKFAFLLTINLRSSRVHHPQTI